MKLIAYNKQLKRHIPINLAYLDMLLDYNRTNFDITSNKFERHIPIAISFSKLTPSIKAKLGSYQMQLNRKSPYFIYENYVYGKSMLLKKLILDYNLSQAQTQLQPQRYNATLYRVKIPQLGNYKSLHQKHNYIESFFDHTEYISLFFEFSLNYNPHEDYIEEEEDPLAIWKEIEEQEEAQIEESTYLQETLGLKPVTDTHLASHHYKKYMPLIPDYKEEDDPDTWYNRAIKEKEERDSSIAQQREELDNYYSSLPPTHHYINKNKRRKDDTQLFD